MTRALGAIAMLIATLLVSFDAAADARSAVAALYANLERNHYEAPEQSTVVIDGRTLVDGVYRLEERSTGHLVGLFTESGDVLGDGSGWKWIEAGRMRPLSSDETARLRAEVMRSVEWDRLVRVPYGEGGGRHVIVISAVNCPVCARMEAALARRAGSLDTTLYVLPISLTPSIDGDEGKASWRQAATLACASDGAAAWRRFWAVRQLPSATTRCTPDERDAWRLARNFATVLSSVGIRVSGTPTLLREDGARIPFPADPDDRDFDQSLGPAALAGFASPLRDQAALRWLATRREGAAWQKDQPRLR